MRTLLDLLSELLFFYLSVETISMWELKYLLLTDKQFNVEFEIKPHYVPMCFFLQRSAEDQPDEQEKGSWQSGTNHERTDVFTVDGYY